MSDMSTVLLAAWLMPLTLYVMCVYIPHIFLAQMAYIANLLGIFVYGTYLAITCLAENEVVCGFACVCKFVGS